MTEKGRQPLDTSRPVILAFLEYGGHVRQTCVGCSGVLHWFGLLELVERVPFSHSGAYGSPTLPNDVAIYRLAPGVTLDECREAVKLRHKGEPFGQ